ncbi:MAG: hypothetical protein ABEJ35_05865 [Halobacteriaceae archaeon]
MDGGSDEGAVGSRVPGSRVRVWLLLTGDRRLVTGAVLGAVFGIVFLAGVLDSGSLRRAATVGDPLETVF